MRFSGSLVPLITPFYHSGKIDSKTLRFLVEWHISSGTDGIVCCATTGEGPALTDRERKKIAEICIEVSNGRIPILLATGTSDTRTTIRNTEVAQKIGADGCLVVTPYYNRPTQRGCLLHFQEVAKVGLPVIIYHNPPRAAVKLNQETILELAEHPNIVGIKESSRDLELIRKISKKIPVFSGEDDLVLEIMKEGAVGSIATCSNLIPHGWKRMILFCQKQNWDKAGILAKKYLPIARAIFLETNPQGIKFALSTLGKCKAALRLPLVQATGATQKEIQLQLLLLALPFFQRSKIFS